MKKIVVQNESGRIDLFLSENTDYSRNQINNLLENACILVNNKSVKNSYKIKEGDQIEFVKELDISTTMVPTQMDLNIVYEDEDIMVIDKPSGLVVHPGSGNHDNTLANGLLYYTKELSDVNGENRPGIVHRIDKDTSGLLLVAKTNSAHQILADNFKNKLVKREYIALLEGVFPNKRAIIDAPIGRDELNRKKMTVTEKNSKDAVTHLEVVTRYVDYTLVSLKLETGRTHQIRVHMNYIGYPVFNDPVYSRRKSTEFGQFLHSAKLDFIHPITKKEMSFSSPLPNEFAEFLETLAELDTDK